MTPIPLGILAASGFGVVSAFDLLETTTLTSSASSVTFSGLGAYSDYKHLQIRAVTQDTAGNTNMNNAYIKLNGSSGLAYPRHALYADGSSVTSSGNTGTTTGGLYFDVYSGGSNTDIFGAQIIDILDFANTNKNTTIRIMGGGLESGQQSIGLFSTLYNSTTAVTSIELFSVSGDDAAGSRFSLYGIKG